MALISYSRQQVLPDLVLSRLARRLVYMQSVLTLDQSSIAPNTVLTSAMKRVDNAVYEAVQELIDGTLEGGVKTFDLAAGGVDIARLRI